MTMLLLFTIMSDPRARLGKTMLLDGRKLEQPHAKQFGDSALPPSTADNLEDLKMACNCCLRFGFARKLHQ